jgi:hypothetical protein
MFAHMASCCTCTLEPSLILPHHNEVSYILNIDRLLQGLLPWCLLFQRGSWQAREVHYSGRIKDVYPEGLCKPTKRSLAGKPTRDPARSGTPLLTCPVHVAGARTVRPPELASQEDCLNFIGNYYLELSRG